MWISSFCNEATAQKGRKAPKTDLIRVSNSFANVADVGGVYNGQWVQGVTRWTTTVYRKPVKLPRTGY